MAPFVLFGILTYSTSLFERYYASGLPDGDLSYLGYASKISEIMMALIGAGIAAAIFPAMARAYVQTGEGGLVEKAEYGLRLTLAVAMPAWAIVSAVAVPLVTFLFERGAFQHTTTLSVSPIVPIVMIGAVVFPMVSNLINRTYYATKDTHTVSIVAAVTSGLYILLAKVLVDAWGYVGLAWARPLCAGLTILVLSWLLTRRLRSLHTGKLLRETLMYGAASLVAFLATWLVVNVLAFLPALLQSLAAFLVAGSLYMAILFRIDREIAVSVLEMTGVRRIVVGARAAIRLIAETSQG
jgi:putative peptidoglycan lipid II flippase